MKQVTICVPTYNDERFLGRCLESLNSQTYSSIRIEIVDDASTDSSKDIAKAFIAASRFEDITLFEHSSNSGGMGLAVQESMARCKTPYFMWFAGDDELAPTYIETLVSILDTQTSLDYVYSDFQIIDHLSKNKTIWTYPQVSYPSLVKHVLDTQSGILPMVGLIRVSFLREKGLSFETPSAESFSSDTLNSIQFMSRGLRIQKVPLPIFRYRQHETQGSHSFKKRFVSDVNILAYLFLNHRDCLESMINLNLETFFTYVTKSIMNNKSRFKLKDAQVKEIVDSQDFQQALDRAIQNITQVLKKQLSSF